MALHLDPAIQAIISRYSLQMTFVKNVDEDVVMFVNWAGARSIGGTVEEICGSPSAKFYPENYEAFALDDLEIVESGKPRLGYPEEYVDTSGRTHQLITNKIPFKLDGVNYVVITALDVTSMNTLVSSKVAPGRSFRQVTLDKEQARSREILTKLARLKSD